jgi:hypothetical protein
VTAPNSEGDSSSLGERDQGKEYAAFIAAQLAAEQDRRASFNARAAGGLTGAAGLVTVVLAVFTAFVGRDFKLSGDAKNFLVAALIALLAAALCAVLAGLPWRYKVTRPSTLHHFLGPSWHDSEEKARRRTAYCNAVVSGSLRRGNSIKSALLIAMAACQAIAIAALALCTWAVST